MRPRPVSAVDQRIEEFRAAGDAVGLAAWLLKHRGICPMCAGAVRVTAENAVTGRRLFSCGSCMWAADVSESQYRELQPHIGLGGVVQAALNVKAATEVARRSVRRPRRRPRTRPSTSGE